jgi:hypothetical protein
LPSPGNYSIPPEGVSISYADVGSLESSFYIPSDAEVIASVNVQNLIGVNDRAALGPLIRVETDLVYNLIDASGQRVRYPGPKLKLAPFGSDGSMTDQRFIKPRSGPVGVSITGTAYFRDGEVTLTPTDLNHLNVKITREMLSQ